MDLFVLSTSPWLALRYVLPCTCFMPNALQKSLNDFDTNVDPLSLCKTAGIPYLQHTWLNKPFAKLALLVSLLVQAVTCLVA